jgi:hypothetical protein
LTDLSETIAPKSDQLNSDDLISGPRTVTITKVSYASAEQPIAIGFDGDDGKPYMPCKSMRRVLVQIWGKDGNAYTGRSMTLYRDKDVMFGGQAVGGIRISHMTGIDKPVTMALTATRASRKPFTVKPLQMQERQQAQPEQKRKTWADVFPEIQAELDAAATEAVVHAVAARDLVRKGLEKPETQTAQRLNAMIKAALDRVADPVPDEIDDVPTTEDAGAEFDRASAA